MSRSELKTSTRTREEEDAGTAEGVPPRRTRAARKDGAEEQKKSRGRSKKAQEAEEDAAEMETGEDKKEGDAGSPLNDEAQAAAVQATPANSVLSYAAGAPAAGAGSALVPGTASTLASVIPAGLSAAPGMVASVLPAIAGVGATLAVATDANGGVKQDAVAPGNRPMSPTALLEKAIKTSQGYQCPWQGCQETFAKRFSLKRHMKKHTGERPYPCTFPPCTKSFAEKSTLKRHLRTHTGERPYFCKHPGCTKSFADRTNVRRHQLIHTGEKPYSCPHAACARRFTRKSVLRKHLITRHKGDPSILIKRDDDEEDDSDDSDDSDDEVGLSNKIFRAGRFPPNRFPMASSLYNYGFPGFSYAPGTNSAIVLATATSLPQSYSAYAPALAGNNPLANFTNSLLNAAQASAQAAENAANAENAAAEKKGSSGSASAAKEESDNAESTEAAEEVATRKSGRLTRKPRVSYASMVQEGGANDAEEGDDEEPKGGRKKRKANEDEEEEEEEGETPATKRVAGSKKKSKKGDLAADLAAQGFPTDPSAMLANSMLSGLGLFDPNMLAASNPALYLSMLSQPGLGADAAALFGGGATGDALSALSGLGLGLNNPLAGLLGLSGSGLLEQQLLQQQLQYSLLAAQNPSQMQSLLQQQQLASLLGGAGLQNQSPLNALSMAVSNAANQQRQLLSNLTGSTTAATTSSSSSSSSSSASGTASTSASLPAATSGSVSSTTSTTAAAGGNGKATLAPTPVRSGVPSSSSLFSSSSASPSPASAPLSLASSLSAFQGLPSITIPPLISSKDGDTSAATTSDSAQATDSTAAQ